MTHHAIHTLRKDAHLLQSCGVAAIAQCQVFVPDITSADAYCRAIWPASLGQCAHTACTPCTACPKQVAAAQASFPAQAAVIAQSEPMQDTGVQASATAPQHSPDMVQALLQQLVQQLSAPMPAVPELGAGEQELRELAAMQAAELAAARQAMQLLAQLLDSAGQLEVAGAAQPGTQLVSIMRDPAAEEMQQAMQHSLADILAELQAQSRDEQALTLIAPQIARGSEHVSLV